MKQSWSNGISQHDTGNTVQAGSRNFRCG